MANGIKHRGKRLFLINRDFQLRYTRAALGVGILSTILTAVVILYPLYSFEILRIANFLPLPILATMVLACFINVGFLAVMGIIVTHKIAGPMYSLVRHFRLVGMGRLTDVMRLREDDEMKFVVRNFNEMVDELRHLTQDDAQNLDEILVLLDAVGNGDHLVDVRAQILEVKNRLLSRVQKP